MNEEQFIASFELNVVEPAVMDWDNLDLTTKETYFSRFKDLYLEFTEITQQVYDSIGTLPEEFK